MWFDTGSGRITLQMTLKQAESASHQGECDDDVLFLSKLPSIARQLAKIDAELLRTELKEYGAWDDAELQDHEQNLQRILWIAAGDIVENQRERKRKVSSEPIDADTALNHDNCKYLGNDAWDCGHIDNSENCDCHVCSKRAVS